MFKLEVRRRFRGPPRSLRDHLYHRSLALPSSERDQQLIQVRATLSPNAEVLSSYINPETSPGSSDLTEQPLEL